MNSEKYAALFFDLIHKNLKTFQDFREHNILLYLWLHFGQHKYVTCQFSSGMHRAAIWHSEKTLIESLYWTFISPIFPGTTIPCFTIMPYSCHCYLVAPTFVSNYFQEWNTLRVKLEPKYLMSTLRTHWKLQLLLSNQILMQQFLKYSVKHPTSFMLYSFIFIIKIF